MDSFSSVLAETQCAYSTGMFQNDQLGEHNMFTVVSEMNAACFHEASHAVAMYAFGISLSKIGVSATYSVDGAGGSFVSYAGEVRPISRAGRTSCYIDYPYRPLHFRRGVTSAVGPAGERRFRLERGIPLRMLGATEGDHGSISTIGKCLGARGRNRFAFQRLVWRAAQRIVALEDVWSAISEVAEELSYATAGTEDESNANGTVWGLVEPADVYRICRRNGVRRGAFLRTGRPTDLRIFITEVAA
ncbi:MULTISPECIES: hypothetical protein [unclassified Chelatococcus]|uniref:hypothetical protein n=1 Tax=unclassified Chelatococcus TaxID=2638111 RepID=UPI001BCAB611|nr:MULTISPECIES: hypothetical protein [unclassified Chelatococcus]MBS7696222.1 hypothetical protein [Chelatococcus sp. YT9]MBX3557751.1 hypothetical protein [Chelatococcus sp.]